MKSTIKILSLAFGFLFLNSCDSINDSFELQKSIFIEDVENPGLPIYSEWGYNTFGAYIDRTPFASNNLNLPTKIIVHSDTLNILFKGKMNNEETNLRFSLKGYPIANYSNLTLLNNVQINLKSAGNTVELTRNNITEKLTIIEGSFEIKRVQNLYIDNQYTKAIISGVFNLKTFFGDEPVAISNGRFDLGIGYENFYNF